MSDSLDRKPSWPVRVGGLLLLGLAGAGVGYVVGGTLDVGALSWDDALAWIIAAMLLTTAAALTGVVAMRPDKLPGGCGVLQVIVLALAGLLMLAPMVGAATASPKAVFIGLVVVCVAQTIINLMLWRRADEMLRRVMLETSALAFWPTQMALFLYAGAERLGLAGGVSAWGMIGLMMTIYLLASSVAAMRRGLH